MTKTSLLTIVFFRLLKLMLGIAVTCANRQTFIAKIQSLDAETQHSLTQSAASFIIVKVARVQMFVRN